MSAYTARYASGAPRALESVFGMGGQAFTAHPHTDPHTGRMIGWGWRSLVAQRAVEATFWEWDHEWVERGETVHLLSACEVGGTRARDYWGEWVGVAVT